MPIYHLHDKSGAQVNDPALALAMGAVLGASTINKFGASDVAADTPTDIWDGVATYAFPTTALITHVSQTTDQVALRGGLVNVQGLDANWEAVTQIVTLDAADTTTPVALATPLIRCFRALIMGSVACDSTVRVHNAGETVDYAVITVGHNQTLMAVYTVPAGKTAFMAGYYVSVTNLTNRTPTNTEILLEASNNVHGALFTTKHANSIPKEAPGVDHRFNPYYKFTEKTDILISALCADWPGHVHARFDLILVDNVKLEA